MLYRIARFVITAQNGTETTAHTVSEAMLQLNRLPLRSPQVRTTLRQTINQVYEDQSRSLEPVQTLVMPNLLVVVEKLTDSLDRIITCANCGRKRRGSDMYDIYCSLAPDKTGLYCVPCLGQIIRSLCVTCQDFHQDVRGLSCLNCIDPSKPCCMNCMAPVEDIKAGLCDGCARDGHLVPYRADVLQALNKIVRPRRDKLEHRPLLLGVELEIAPYDRATRLALREEIANFAIMKDDRSIQPIDGVEIVTLPLTLEEHAVQWEPVFKKVIEQSCKAHDLCGLHVHFDVNWSLVGPWAKQLEIGDTNSLTASKILKFVHRPSNIKLLEKVAGRPLVGKWAKQYFFQAPAQRLGYIVRLNSGQEAHHSALNVSRRNNNATLELRIFASTANYEEFMGRLEFTASLPHFAGETGLRQLLAKDYLEWLEGKSYPFLKFLLQMREKAPKASPAVASKLRHLKKLTAESRINWPTESGLVVRPVDQIRPPRRRGVPGVRPQPRPNVDRLTEQVGTNFTYDTLAPRQINWTAATEVRPVYTMPEEDFELFGEDDD